MNLQFKLTEEEEALSKKLIGVVGRVIIPNGHMISNFEGYTDLFPENRFSIIDTWNWVSAQPHGFTVVTNSPGIIMSVPTCCVRIAKSGQLVPLDPGVRTFAANIGELYIDVFGLNGGLIPEPAANYIRALEARTANEMIHPNEIDVIGEEMIRYALHRKNGSLHMAAMKLLESKGWTLGEVTETHAHMVPPADLGYMSDYVLRIPTVNKIGYVEQMHRVQSIINDLYN